MQFIDTAPLYKLIRITGPGHNLLGLWLASGPTEREPEVDAVVLNPNEPVRLNAREIVEQVMRGVTDACRELNQPYYIDKIQYVTGDTRRSRSIAGSPPRSSGESTRRGRSRHRTVVTPMRASGPFSLRQASAVPPSELELGHRDRSQQLAERGGALGGVAAGAGRAVDPSRHWQRRKTSSD